MKCCRASDIEDKYCILANVESSIVTPKTCVRVIGQFFCYDIRCALPCEPQIPCMVTACFCTLCYNYNCTPAMCNRVADFMQPEDGTTVNYANQA